MNPLQTLPQESLLQLLAEIGVAFVGFSMLASVVRTNRGDDKTRFADFRNVAETGLWATLGSVAPLILHALGWQEETIWRAASGGVTLVWAVGALAANRRQAFLVERAKERPIRIASVHTVSASVVGLGAWNVLVSSPSSGGLHVLLIGLCIAQSAQLFLLAGFEDSGARAPRGDDLEVGGTDDA